MKQKLIIWLLNQLGFKPHIDIIPLSKKEIIIINDIKAGFKGYFNGNLEMKAIASNLPLCKLLINELKFQFLDKLVIVDVVLERSKLLTKNVNIQDLEAHLSTRKYNVKINLVESQLWKYIKNK